MQLKFNFNLTFAKWAINIKYKDGLEEKKFLVGVSSKQYMKTRETLKEIIENFNIKCS